VARHRSKDVAVSAGRHQLHQSRAAVRPPTSPPSTARRPAAWPFASAIRI
jgi:hypothetical protein